MFEFFSCLIQLPPNPLNQIQFRGLPLFYEIFINVFICHFVKSLIYASWLKWSVMINMGEKRYHINVHGTSNVVNVPLFSTLQAYLRLYCLEIECMSFYRLLPDCWKLDSIISWIPTKFIIFYMNNKVKDLKYLYLMTIHSLLHVEEILFRLPVLSTNMN